jgi:hypothetical protein
VFATLSLHEVQASDIEGLTGAAAGEVPHVHYSFVVDAPGRYGYQAYLLTRSLIEFGGVSPDQISAYLVAGTDGAVDDALRAHSISTRWVEPFGHPYCNRLQQLACLTSIRSDWFVLLDTDMFAIRPLELPPGDEVVWGKMVDAPNPPVDILGSIYERAQLRMDEAEADVIAGQTVRGNFNGGLYVVPRRHLMPLADAWLRWARWSLDHIALFAQWHANVDQVSFALAVAELDLPIGTLGREFNAPTHLGPVTVSRTPAVLHYHQNVDDQLFLKPSGDPGIDAAVSMANETIRRWRRSDLSNALFWSARYDLFPSLGSGRGSRGSALQAKRYAIRRLTALLALDSVVDIGGGDGVTLEGLADGMAHYATDVSATAADAYMTRNPSASWVMSDIIVEPSPEADLAVCLDVVIHLSDPHRYRMAVANAMASGRRATLISGFDRPPRSPGTLTYFHRSLLEEIERRPTAVAYPVLAYDELTAYVVQVDAETGHPSDVQPATLRRSIPLTEDPFALFECVHVSRNDLGFFPDDAAACVGYPWLLRQIRDLKAPGLRILDVGPEETVLPLLLRRDGHLVDTVASQPETKAGGPFDLVYSLEVSIGPTAATRRSRFAQLATLLIAGGNLMLTLKLRPLTRRLDGGGSLEEVLTDLESVGFEVSDVQSHDLLPDSAFGVALISAKRGSAQLTASTAGHTASNASVTVLVPAYRPGMRFVGLLESIAAQTYGDVVIRVSLDHAPSHSMPQLPDLRGRRLEVIEQPERLGWVGNVNAMLRTVDTPYFALLMHDDQLSPRYLEAAVGVLERDPSVVVAHGTLRHHGIRDGEVEFAPSISGDRMQRLMACLERGPHETGLGWRGVVRSALLQDGLRLRTRRSDGMLSNVLMAFEMLVYGESASVPDIYYDKFTDPDGLSRDYHQRTYEQRSEMLADNLACLVDVVTEAGFSEQEQTEVIWRYANWLLGLQGNWNVVGEERNSDSQSYAAVRPAIARFVANALISAGRYRRVNDPLGQRAEPQPSGPPSAGAITVLRSARRWLSRTGRSGLLRLPHQFRSNPLFDADWYRERYADVGDGLAKPYADYWRHGIAAGRDPNPLFDTDWYLAQNPDVQANGMDPLDHYFRFGAREGRDPGPEFDTDWYLARYPDVAENGMNPLLHYLRHGEAEGRMRRADAP